MARPSIGVLTPKSTDIEIVSCSDTFKEAQKVVGGFVERVLLTKVARGNLIYIYLNEEGKMHNLEPTAIGNYVDSNGNFLGRDFLVGNLVIAKESRHGNGMQLLDEDIKTVKSLMSIRQTEMQPNGTDFLFEFKLVN